MSEEKQQLDAEVQAVLKANVEADQKIEALISGKQGSQTESEESSDLYLRTKTNEDLQNYVDNKWGFLRNVININSFFSDGDNASGGAISAAASQEEEEPEAQAPAKEKKVKTKELKAEKPKT